MKINCPHCNVRGSADDAYLGKTVRCPKCQETFLVEETLAHAAVAAGRVSEVDQDAGDAAGIDVVEQQEGMLLQEEILVEDEPELVSKTDELLEPENESDVATEIVSQVEQLGVAPSEEQAEASGGISGEVGSGDEPPADSSAEPVTTSAEGRSGEPQLVKPTIKLQPALSVAPALYAEKVRGEETDDLPPSEDDSTLPPELPEAAENAGLPLKPDEATAGEAALSSLVENEPYGVSKEQCWQCGKVAGVGEPFIAKDGRLYCTDCVPEDDQDAEEAAAEQTAAGLAEGGDKAAEQDDLELPPNYLRFTIGEALKEAWKKIKGAKGTIWAGTAIMYLVILVVVAGGAVLLPTSDADVTEVGTLIASGIFQAVTDALSVLFTGGLVFMAIRKAGGNPIHWKMIFRGFQLPGKIVVATILQTILVLIGFLLLVLPGIYLMVGYAMTIPLIVDREMSPWQAMETSRKTVHKIWWKMAFLFLIMGLIFLLSMIPVGLGLIWTWPMFLMLAGVVYRYLFGSEKAAE